MIAGIFYYDVENISESKLALREKLDECFQHEEKDIKGAILADGGIHDEYVSQEIGHVVAKQGRCLVFPNTYQQSQITEKCLFFTLSTRLQPFRPQGMSHHSSGNGGLRPLWILTVVGH